MANLRCVLFDLDGTLYRGDEALPEAVEVVRELRDRGVLVRYLTNNSTQLRSDFEHKLRRMGFPVEAGEVYNSAYATALYLRDRGLQHVFVLGEPGLIQTLQQAGLTVVNNQEGAPSPLFEPYGFYGSAQNYARTEDGYRVVLGGSSPHADRWTPPVEPADAVVVGLCREYLTFDLISAAMAQIRAGAQFVATNPDTTFPLEEGRLIPGAGTIVAAVAACSEREPFVVGKPNPYMIEMILREADVPAEEALLVGDRLDTDIESANRAGVSSYLVLTGIATELPKGQTGGPTLRGVLETRP